MMRPWIAIHETGGTVSARNGRYLTLPMPAALRVDGRLKRRSAQAWSDYGTFVFKSKRGNKFIAYKQKGTNRLILLYLLIEEVTMKKRLGLLQAIRRQENAVVFAWQAAVMEIFNGLDLYGVAFEGLRVE